MIPFANDTDSRSRAFAEWFIDPNKHHSSAVMNLVLLINAIYGFFGTSFTSYCILASGLWLIYRAFSVLRVPLDDLVSTLGHELPQGPRLELASVKADAVILHWQPADDRKSTHRFEVHVNGVSAGQISAADTAFVISNLAPDHIYIFRVVVFNAPDFKASSAPVRIRTKPSSSGDYYVTPASSSSAEHRETSGFQSGPIIKPLKAVPDLTISSITAPAMVREPSNGPLTSKRVLQNRRPSPATQIPEGQDLGFEHDDSTIGQEESQQQLTERLEEIGRETAEIEKQIQEEEQEAASIKHKLLKERDELRMILKDKENASKDLRKQVSALERENTAAQARRTAQDRQLQQRIAEMQKVKDDTKRLAKEIEDNRRYVQNCAVEKDRMLERTEADKLTLQEKLDEETQALKVLDDEVREQNLQLKRLERGKTNSPASGEHNDNNESAVDHEAEAERIEIEQAYQFQAEYKNANHDMEMARRLCHEQHIQLLQLQEQARQRAYYNAPFPQQQPISRHNSTRQRRGPSDPFVPAHISMSRYLMGSEASFNNTMVTAGPTDPFGSRVTPFFNVNNGMSLDANHEGLDISASELERLTGGAPMSPSAGADLLPADLLSTADEEPPARAHSGSVPPADSANRSGSNEALLPGLGAFGSTNMLPGLGVSNISMVDGPASPGSVSSRSPSVFASPLASSSNLAFHSPEGPMDSDGRSIRSLRSMRPASGGTGPPGSRFAQILGLNAFNRQRGKTVTDDTLALGRLHSQSMPKDAGQDDALAASSKRRNSSHSGNFFGTFRAGFGNKPSEEDQQPIEKAVTPRRKPFMGFGGKDGWGLGLGAETQPTASRPGSTHSLERSRLSDSGSHWAFWQSGDALSGRTGSGATDWSQPPPSSSLSQHRSWGSRLTSRRPSDQFGSGSGITFGIEENDDNENEDSEPNPILAPIGTKRVAPIERPETPKLNPAAKDFKHLFSFNEGKKEKGDKKDKSKDQESAPRTPDMNQLTPSTSAHSPLIPAQYDTSPPQSRQSKDARSVLTAESSNNEASSTHSLDQTPSHTPSDVPTSSSLTSSAGKGSFMRKLSRKHSGGKFGLPVFQRDKKAKTAEKTLNEETESPEDISEAAGTDKEDSKRLERTPSRSWNVFSSKMGKGKDKKEQLDKEKTPSVSEASTTSASDAAVDAGEE